MLDPGTFAPVVMSDGGSVEMSAIVSGVTFIDFTEI
jgi:Fe-S cluster biogenesis protein NfuA